MSDGPKTNSTAGKRILDPVRGDYVHPKTIEKRRRANPGAYDAAPGDGNGNRQLPIVGDGDGNGAAGNPERGEAISGGIAGANGSVAEIAADFARAERQRTRQGPTADPTAEETPGDFSEGQASSSFDFLDPTPTANSPRSQKRAAKNAVSDANYIGDTLLNAVDQMVGALVAPRARMTDKQRADIAKPLFEMIGDLDTSVIAQAKSFANPVALVFAVGAWGTSVYRVAQEERAAADGFTAPPTPTAEPTPAQRTTPTGSRANDNNGQFRPGVNPYIAGLYPKDVL